MKNFRFACCLVLSSVASTCFAQSNPVPFVDQPLVPAAVTPGAPAFTLTIHGAGFISGSTIDWNGAPLATTFVSAGKLTAVVPATNVSAPGAANITVVSPGPGGGSSNPAPFTITTPTSNLVFSAFSVAGSTSPISAVTADFNHDGIPDLAVIDSASGSCNYEYGGVGSIAIFLGNGDGTFTKHSTLCFVDETGETPQSLILTGDLNRDGNVDLVAVSNYEFDGDQTSIFYGNGDGTFAAPVEGDSYGYLYGLALGDFNSSGQLELAASYWSYNGFGYVLAGDDVLYLEDSVGVGGPLVAGNFSADGLLDLASPSKFFLNDGNGDFTQLNDIPFGNVSGDFNGDGVLDLASSSMVLLGNGDGTFTQKDGQPPSAEAVSFSADINGDGILDLVGTDSNGVGAIWLGNGDGTFQAPVETPGFGAAAAADVNGDGRMDLVGISGSTVTVLLQATATCGNPSQNSPNSGTYNVPPTTLPLVITWSNPTAGCVLHYTTDGSAPTASSPTYPGGGLSIYSTTTVRVIAVAAGYNSSAIIGGKWTLNLPTCGNPSQNSPYSGTYDAPPTRLPLIITWTNPTSACVLHYTTDGSAPTASSPTYPSGGLSIDSTTTIRVIAAATGYNSSAIIGGKWTIN